MTAVAARLAGLAAAGIFGPLLRTLRFDVEGAEHVRRARAGDSRVIYVVWHGRLLPLAFLHRGEDVTLLVSASRDGDAIATVLHRWGYHTVRGSSSRAGSSALRSLVRHAVRGRSIAMTPDGPRGPREVLKPGPLVAAQLTGLPIVPVACAATRAWWFGRWDRFLIPRPFARIHVAYGAPVRVPRDLAPAGFAEILKSVQGKLDELTNQVDRRVGAS